MHTKNKLVNTIHYNGKKKNPIGKLCLCAFNSESERIPFTFNYGHSFVIIQNDSDKDIYINDFCLKAHQRCSIGSWGQRHHIGLWYNLEIYYFMLNRYVGRACLITEIEEDDIPKLADFIRTHDHWSTKYNCSTTAIGMYNSVCNKEDIIEEGKNLIPGKLYDKICMRDTHLFDQTLEGEFSKPGYFSEDGYEEYDFDWKHKERYMVK